MPGTGAELPTDCVALDPARQKCGKCLPIPAGTRRTLPDNQNTPARRQQCVAHASVALHIGCELSLPELLSRSGHPGMATSRVGVPETTMNKHDDSTPRQNDVGMSGQVLPVQTEAETCCKEGLADDDFRLCVPPSDAGHHPASRRRVDDIGHRVRPDEPRERLPTAARTGARTLPPCTPAAWPTRRSSCRSRSRAGAR